MAEPRALTHDELLLWLHDHRARGGRKGGGRVRRHDGAGPRGRAGDASTSHVVSPRGTELAGRSGEQIIGVYLIDTRPPLPAGGYVIFNVSDLGEFPAYTTFDGGVAVTSGQGVALTIHEPKAKPD